ncbi:TPA: hypothetical protein DD425_03295 [Candidatus Saccharibacteria bacterium]|nr:hypothetical protein [Candidatus Saccharibacteria bacterium]
MGIKKGFTMFLGACVAALTALTLTACAGMSQPDINLDELAKRGFTDVTEQGYVASSGALGYGDSATYFANAGGCRVVLRWVEYPDEFGYEWVLIENSSKGDDYNVILPNPTTLKVGELDAFQHCYNVDEVSTE